VGRHILLIQGHPDASQRHLCHALEDAYVQGANAAGHEVQRINVATLDFPILRSQLEWEQGELPTGLAPAQDAIKWAEHMVLFFPLWLGDMPALLKGFLEQVARPGFAFSRNGKNPLAV
jgi:putative NADPH-quinone reductase